MKTEQFLVVHDEAMKTGECQVWHAVESALYWVDIPGFTVHRLHPASGKYSSWKMASEPSALAVARNGRCLGIFITVNVLRGRTLRKRIKARGCDRCYSRGAYLTLGDDERVHGDGSLAES